MLNPREIAEKQVRRSQQATDDYSKGVEGVTESPGAKAAKKKDKFRANLLAAIDSGKWADNVGAVDLDSWKRKTKAKGSARYSEGVADAADDILAFHEEFGAFLQGHMSKIDALPDTTPEQRLQKMVENARGIAKFHRTRRRR